MLSEQLGMQEGQFNRVGDLFDLGVETTDIGVREIGDLFEEEILHLGPGKFLEQQVAACIEAHGVARTQVDATEIVGEFADTLFVGAPHHDGAHAVVHDLFDGDHLTGDLRVASRHHVEALVEHYFGATIEFVMVDLGMQRHAHLAAAHQYVDGAVVVLTHHHAIGRRRLAELVDFVAQGGNVFAGLTQGVAQLLITRHRLRQLALGFEEPLFERTHPLGRVGQFPAQFGNLLIEHLCLRAQCLDRFVVCLGHIVNLHAPRRAVTTFAPQCGHNSGVPIGTYALR